MNHRLVPLVSATAFVVAIVLANWLTDRYGFVAVGFGLSATAGTFAAGATFTLRDQVQDSWGRAAVLAVIAIGVVVSWFVSSAALATASGAAFLISELADFAVYTPLRRRNWSLAVLLSGLVGAVVDSFVFLWIAFGRESVTRASIGGQVLGKMWAVAAVWLVILAITAVARSREASATA